MSLGSLVACAGPAHDLELLQGPAIADIVTPFDDALVCMEGRIDSRLAFGVGGIPDQTGRDQNSGEGTARFVTQGAGDIVQSALFKAGVTVINRRDMGAAAMEAQWGLRDLSNQRPAHFVITGSINSLDFIPGGGAFVSVGGVGPRYRQNRILVGMDLAMTNNATGQVVANIALRKQIFADEFGLMVARFMDDTVVDVDFGGSRREAVHYALRQMLQLATFELLAQMMPPERYRDCREMIDARMGSIEGDRTTGEQMRELDRREEELSAAEEGAAEPEARDG
ncbi:HfaB protein [Rhodobacteraceae bacterium WD3A24]|nr:HfaB protein [Rhodobacteraceae bacterium WD3A24]